MQKQLQTTTRHRQTETQNVDRQGSTLLIVIALLGMLALLGVVFYTFAAQERSNAEYFSEAAKGETDPGLTPDVLFNWGLEQLIVGPENHQKNSALWGKRHSMLPNMLGRDIHPYTGKGVHVIDDGSGTPIVDQDYDGNSDSSQHLLNFNDSPAVRGGNERDLGDSTRFPDSGVGYTYPDINNLFLAYKGKGLDSSGNPIEVIIPSFHRPQYLRQGGSISPTWYQDGGMSQRLFRPHPDHVHVRSGQERFIEAGDPEASQVSSPFPFAPTDDQAGVARQGEMGVWTNSGENIYELDVDNDNDGIREGIWMDLDFPVQEIDGTTLVPLFSFTVYDADALLNLNIHGNHAGEIDLAQTPFGGRNYGVGADGQPGTANVDDDNNGIMDDIGELGQGDDQQRWVEYITQSNQGLSPAEVNPQWALNADPATGSGADFEQHDYFFGNSPNNRRELSNMEWWFAMMGRGELSSPAGSPSDMYAGRYGELNILYNGINSGTAGNRDETVFSRAGYANQDDNNNRNEGTVQGTRPAFGQPLDFAGTGRFVRPVNSRRADLVKPFNNNPSVWLRYSKYGLGFSQAGQQGNAQWWTALNNGQLMPATQTDVLWNDPMEIVLQPEQAQQGVDEIFGADEMAFLHMKQADIDNTKTTSRVEKLLPFNFKNSDRAQEIREKFTTQSWDRKQFGIPRFEGFREWEFNPDPSGNPQFFPPEFGVAADSSDDPFRQPVRDLLEIEFGNKTRPKRQFPLSVNQVLERRDGQLTYRNLTPHPNPQNAQNFPNTPVPNTWNRNTVQNNRPSFPPQTLRQREFWARYDRQRLARDIYVMLYTFGGGRDEDGSGQPVNYATTANTYTGSPSTGKRTLFNDNQLREMAHFAVNLVDSMDPDDVITKFEYDKELSDGWNLDDNPYGNPEQSPFSPGDDGYNPDYPEDSTSRGVVYGVEEQKLTLSEAMVVLARQVTDGGGNPVNHDATDYNDEEHRDFAYVELRNASPHRVDLNDGSWQIAVEIENFVEAERRHLTIQAGSVNGGRLFTLGSAGDDHNKEPDGVTPKPSHYLVDPNYTSGNQPNPVKIAPVGGLNLDLITEFDANTFLLNEGTGENEYGDGSEINDIGDFIHFSDDPTSRPTGGDNVQITFKLRRRAHLNRQSPESYSASPANHQEQSQDNPWVEVDRITVPLRIFALQQNDESTQIQNKLKNLKSRERKQPLDGRDTPQSQPMSPETGNRRNSLGQNNDSSPAQFTLWQPHFNRALASIVELMALPIVGPHDLTKSIAGDNPPRMSGFRTAAFNFLQPEHPSNFGNPTPNRKLNNRWYRLLEFVEVPTRTHRQLGNPLNNARVPGKLNLNTTRHQEVLAGLLDDREIFRQDFTNPDSYLPDREEGTNRDWWRQFVLSRDRKDQAPATAGYVLPGVPNSQPFRSFNYLAHADPSSNPQAVRNLIEHTLLRHLPTDLSSNPDNPRGLFEVGTWMEHDNNSVDTYTRHRLLSKIMGNSTTRSNAFIVFITVGFFEAVEDPDTGAVKIGGEVGSDVMERHRGFFIVDRSQVEEAYNPASQTFDFKPLVIYRNTIKP